MFPKIIKHQAKNLFWLGRISSQIAQFEGCLHGKIAGLISNITKYYSMVNSLWSDRRLVVFEEFGWYCAKSTSVMMNVM